MAGLHDAALTERDAELSVIDQDIAAVRRGSSRLLVIEGQAGIGKTRLLAAARERARVAELSDLHAHASPLERSYAFGVVRQLFEPALSALDRKQREEVLSGHARGAARPLALDPNARRTGEDAMYLALNGLYWLCLNLAERAPLSLTIDDAHWADEPSLRFISFVASRLDDAPVLIALTARPGEPGTDALAAISDLQSFPFVETLALRPLSSAAVEGLTGAALGRRANTSFAAACHTATGGNPLLLHELLLEAKAAGIAPTAEGAGRIAALGPARVSAGVLARVRRLGASAVRLTEALAVLGDNARLPHAAALAGLDEQEAQRAATALIDAGVLLEAFPLSFTHPLVRQAIYEHLPYGERLAAHDRAASILHAAGTRAEAIASHLLLTQPQGDGEVVELLRRAAADATAQGSPDCAAQYLRRALIEPPAAELRGELLAELGIAEHNSGDPQAVVHLSDALDLAAVPEQRARLGLVLARAIWHTGDITGAVSLLANLIDRIDRPLTAPLEAELIAIARLDPHTRSVGLRRIERRDPDAVQDLEGRRLLLGNLAFEHAVTARQPATRIVQLAQRALANERLLEQEGSESTIYYLAAWALAQCDHYSEAEHAFQAGLALAREEGSIVGYARALTFRSNLCYRRGMLNEAQADIEHALEHLTPVRAPLAVAFLLDVLLEHQQLDAAQDALERFDLADELPDSILHTIVLERRARLRLAQHRAEDALDDILLCQRRAQQWHADSPAFLPWRTTAALVLSHTGRDSEATGLAEAERRAAQRFGAPRAVGIALRAQGLLSTRPDDISLLAEAVLMLQSTGATLEHARALIDLGSALRRAGRRTTAREKLRAGLDLADQCAATALAVHARSELRAAGGRPVAAPRSGRHSLSPAELRVATMAASGLSNRDIAQALFVTPKTVEWHLGQTYRKLAVHSRIQLAAALPPDAAQDLSGVNVEPLAPAG